MSFASPPWRVAQLVERSTVNRVVASPSLAMPVKKMENYPSLAEGNGLENRQACKSVQGFKSSIFHKSFFAILRLHLSIACDLSLLEGLPPV